MTPVPACEAGSCISVANTIRASSETGNYPDMSSPFKTNSSSDAPSVYRIEMSILILPVAVGPFWHDVTELCKSFVTGTRNGQEEIFIVFC